MSTLFAILLLIFDWKPYLQQWMCPNSEMEESMSTTEYLLDHITNEEVCKKIWDATDFHDMITFLVWPRNKN